MTPGPDPEGSGPRAMAATGAATDLEHSRTRAAIQPWAAETGVRTLLHSPGAEAHTRETFGA
jgi:hypothetical protein